MATNNVIELDFPKLIEASAAHTVTCDNCNKKLGERYASGRQNISVPLRKVLTGDDMDTPEHVAYADMHYCDEACLLSHLQTRAKSKKK